jgi:AraC-like DNA-binding protein
VISPYHRIYYIDEGEGEISNYEKTLKLEKGHLYIIPSYTLCNLVCTKYLNQFFVQFFEESSDGISLFSNNRSIFKMVARDIDIVNFRRLVEINPGRGINRSDNPKIYEKNNYYNEYQELNNYQNMSDFLETQGILMQLTARFAVPEVFMQKQPRYIPDKILETINFISVSLHMPLSVKFLGERINLHPEYFSRLFEQYTGLRPSLYISQKRIEHAQYLITTSQASYSTIAGPTGFESLSHFSRTFKKLTGLTPTAYKKETIHHSATTHF